MDQPTIGDTVARLRRARGMTQEVLAEAAGLSVGIIQKLERNERSSPRISTLHKLATPLGVPTSALMGDAAEATIQREADDDDLGLIEVRRVLTPARGIGGLAISDIEGPATLADVQASIRLIDQLYHRDNYTAVLQALPRLLVDARQLAQDTAGDEQGDVYGLLATAYQMTGKALLQLRRLDLAHIALSAGLDAADRSSDPNRSGATVVRTMCWLLTRQGRFADAESLAVQTANQVEPRWSTATPFQLANWGWLLLYASGAASRDNRPDDARTQLDAAATAGMRIGQLPPAPFGDMEAGGFSLPKVEYMRVEAAVVAGEPGEALDISARIEPSNVPTPSCRHRHELDVAWAHLAKGTTTDNTKAGEVLLSLGNTAPTWMRQQRYARDLVDQLAASRRRAMSEDLAKLAALVGATPA